MNCKVSVEPAVVVGPPEVADAERVSAPGRGRLLGGVPVAEPGVLGDGAPNRAVDVGAQGAAGPGPATEPGCAAQVAAGHTVDWPSVEP